MHKINLSEKFSIIRDHWNPRIAGELNSQLIKLVKFQGPFTWHHHGPAVANPYDKIDQYIAHRLERETNILKAVREKSLTPGEIVARVYTDVNPKALPMAERAVLAHLEKLQADGLVARDQDKFTQV